MEQPSAIETLRKLAAGINPVTDEAFSKESPYNHPQIIRALHTILEKFPKRKKDPEERRRENLERGFPRNAGLPWTEEARISVKSSFEAGKSVDELAKDYERTRIGIISELLRQGALSNDQAQSLGYTSRFTPRSNNV